ncbi:MAG: hypothetical protein LQ348_000367 [Seirophora lacunosa]|nr:MAG: hypothetical protein LQ348_000367 [Seirophora lacunosa]
MTRSVGPTQAVNIKSSVASHTNCSSTTVAQLESFFFPRAPSKLIEADRVPPVNSIPLSRSAGPQRNGRVRARKQPKVTIHESPEADVSSPTNKEKGNFATEIINLVLKAFTEAVKAPPLTPKECSGEGLKDTSTSRETAKSPNGRRCAKNPLRPLPVNVVCSEKTQDKGSWQSICPDETKAAAGYAAQAECARLAFSALKTFETDGTLGKSVPSLHLESAMSMLVNKLIALELLQPAYRQLRALKQALLAASGSAHPIDSKPHEVACSKERVSDLLVFPSAQLTGSLLALVVTFQLQVLRLIAAKRNSFLLEATVGHLQLETPYSPGRLIQAQHDSADPRAPAKIANQLEALSRLVLSMCPSTSSLEDHKPGYPNVLDPLTALRLQLLALKLRSMWWDTAGHQGDVAKELLVPLGQYLSTFRRRSTTGYEHGYSYVKNTLTGLKLFDQDGDTFSTPSTPCKQAWLSVYSEMIELSLKSCLAAETKNWLEKYVKMPIDNEMSPCKRCTAMCRKAILYSRVTTSLPSEFESTNLLRDAEQLIQGDLDGGSDELDDLLLAIIGLRKAVGLIINQSLKSKDSDGKPPLPQLVQQCYSLCSTCVKFLCRYIGTRPLSADDRLSRRYQQRLRQAVTVTTTFTDSVISTARLMKGDDPVAWKQTDAGLQACLSLAKLTQENRQDDARGFRNGSDSSDVYVSVSNAYWLRYSYLQTKCNAAEASRALKASIDAVDHCQPATKQAAQLPRKFELYGNALEAAQQHGKAVEVYMKAMRLHVEQGVLQKAAMAAATQPVAVLFARQSDFTSLGRVLSAFPRLAVRNDTGTTGSSVIFNDDKLGPAERGVALEHQLSALISQSKSKPIVSQASQAVEYIASELLAVYVEETFPIRRSRVIETLLWMQTSRPEVLPRHVLDPFLDYRIGTSTGKLGGLDSGLQLLGPYLDASRDVALAMREECLVRKQRGLKKAFSAWYLLVERSHDLEALEARVGDPSAWLLHLELLVDYLDACGLSLLRRSTLQLLTTVREDFFPTLCVELAFDLVRLGLQHCRLGYHDKAGLLLHRVQKLADAGILTQEVFVWFYATYAEYLLSIGSIGKCEAHLARAQEIFESSETKHGQRIFSTDRSALLQLVAHVALLCTDLAARRGHHSTALLLARQSLKLAHQAWMSIGRRQKRSQMRTVNISGKGSIDGLAASLAEVKIADHISIEKASDTYSNGPACWRLVHQLHRAFLQVSRLYCKAGMFTDARYYSERSQKFAESVSAPGLAVMSAGHVADLLARSGNWGEADSKFEVASSQFDLLEEDQHVIEFRMNLANHHVAKGQASAAENICAAAEATLQRLLALDVSQQNLQQQPDLVALQGSLSQLTLGKGMQNSQSLKKRAPPRNPARGRPVTNSTGADERCSSDVIASSSTLCQIRGICDRQRSVLAIHQGQLDQAMEFLVSAAKLYCTPEDALQNTGLIAQVHVSRGLEVLNSDPVYCVLHESTVSLPSVVAKKATEPVAPPKASLSKSRSRAVQGGAVGAGRRRVQAVTQASDSGAGDDFLHAQMEISKVFRSARSVCATDTLHRLSKIMSDALLKLSALNTFPQDEGLGANPSNLLSIADMARSVAISRGQLAVQVDKMLPTGDKPLAWPDATEVRAQHLNMADQILDPFALQEQCFDSMPHTWQVLTVSLSRTKGEILVSRTRCGQGPFILSLPLDRHSSRDSDEESFGYSQAKAELRDILTLADESTHNGPGMSGKGARSAWWEGRAALDARLKDFLTNMQNVWFGGFQGVFSQRFPARELLSRFQESLNVVMDNHLPSRRGLAKKQKSQQVSLDPRVTELFVALGDPASFSDMEEPLMDLLYFVVDILQFHGERNAYDEIDFDSMTIEVFDALRQYHDAAKKGDDQAAIEHTILILDKELHCFPWESLPCLDGHALTRLPSLSCLGDRLLQQQQQQQQGQHTNGVGTEMNDKHRFCIDRRRGAFVLNPAGDLEATEAKFEQPLDHLPGWEGVIGSKPSEDQLKSYLEERDIFLYFGHGSGAQYIRSGTVRKLDKCAVALLMGCSSGKLTEAGEFEPYGTLMSYMQAGCPAVVATLWDVTDKDIDRFSEASLQKWGLFETTPPTHGSPIKKNARARGKSKARQSPGPSSTSLSLDQAVAQGRGSCIFRYLNGAAPVVYGIPVFLG